MNSHETPTTELTWQPYETALPNVERQDVQQFEKHLGLRLPADYVETVLAHAGDSTNLERISVGDAKIALFGSLFFMSSDVQYRSHYNNVYKWVNEIKTWNTADTSRFLVPFASDTANGIFCFDFRDDSEHPSVVYLDFEKEFDSESSIVEIANDFEDLLGKLF